MAPRSRIRMVRVSNRQCLCLVRLPLPVASRQSEAVRCLSAVTPLLARCDYPLSPATSPARHDTCRHRCWRNAPVRSTLRPGHVRRWTFRSGTADPASATSKICSCRPRSVMPRPLRRIRPMTAQGPPGRGIGVPASRSATRCCPLCPHKKPRVSCLARGSGDPSPPGGGGRDHTTQTAYFGDTPNACKVATLMYLSTGRPLAFWKALTAAMVS